MEAKDTYIMESKNKLMVLTCHDDLSRELWVDALISEQAEISFKAGIKELVDWVEEHGEKIYEDFHPDFIALRRIAEDEYQAKLKEWHIETE